MADQMVVVRKLPIDGELKKGDFAIPEDIAAQYKPTAKGFSYEDLPLGDSSEPAVELTPGVVLIPVSWNVTLVRQEGGIVILEAPISSGYSEKVIAEAHRRFPGLPIKAVVTTSDSWPHLAGIREYVAEGIPIYALDLNEPILERVIEAPHTSKPDNLQRNAREPQFHLLHEKFVLGSGSNRVEIYPLRGETSERQMMVYFPAHQLLYGSDPFQRNSDGSFSYPQTVTELVDAVRRQQLDVKQFFMMHIELTPWTELQKAIDSANTLDSPNGVL